MNPDENLGVTLNRVVYTEDFTSSIGGLLSGTKGRDVYGHGQHVAGIIASNGKTSICLSCTQNFVGIAPGVNLINLRALDGYGTGSDSSVIAAVERAIELKSKYNIRVINLSLGRPVYESYKTDPLCQAVEAAWKAGIVVVVAAGNDGRDNSFNNYGYGTITAPANDPFVLTVGAMKTLGTNTRTDDLIATYSSKGPSVVDMVVKPDLVAPGNQVVSLLADQSTLSSMYPQNVLSASQYMTGTLVGITVPNKYFTLSGTSMAAAVVSGAAADILQANPLLTPDQVKLLLMQSAYKTFPISSTATDPMFGTTLPRTTTFLRLAPGISI
jgi:serine protease AprX